MKISILSIFSIVLFTICVCQFRPRAGEIVFPFDSQIESGLTITVIPGSLFTFKIKGNITTGYGWFLENNPVSNNYVIPLNLNSEGSTNDYFRDSSLLGGGGSYYFRFRALRRGRINLVFINKQPWNQSTGRRYIFRVYIR